MIKRFCKRPWGWWLVLLDREHFKVKLLRFNSLGSLSRQYHSHRSELWLFLSGGGGFYTGAKDAVKNNYVDCDSNLSDQTVLAGDWALADQGKQHRFRNGAKRGTWVLEIQYGEKCVEEDIVRI